MTGGVTGHVTRFEIIEQTSASRRVCIPAGIRCLVIVFDPVVVVVKIDKLA